MIFLRLSYLHKYT